MFDNPHPFEKDAGTIVKNKIHYLNETKLPTNYFIITSQMKV